MNKHVSVLLNEAIQALDIISSGIYIDCTLGYGGHSSEILKKLTTGHLYAIDQDIDAINESDKKLKIISDRYTLINSNFVNIKEELLKYGIKEVDGILFDLGVSSPQLDEASRGFSYMKDAFLDMRMNKDSKLSAYNVVNEYSVEDLTRIFRIYGEEKHARKIANAIVDLRRNKKINTTLELVDIIDKQIPYREKRNSHPAKKVFQAIRIEVNNELKVLEKALYDALDILKINGRLCVITFHSLEDRICKKIFNEVTIVDPLIKGMPNMNKDLLPNYELVTKKAIKPSYAELANNKRSKSAQLRVIERIK